MEEQQPKLTDVQINCLQLVGEGYTSKEIAKRLGLSPMTVDQYLHRAKKAVGAPDRRTAARWMSESRSPAQFKPLELKSSEVADPAGPVEPVDLSEAGQMTEIPTAKWRGFVSFPPVGGARNTLNASEKTRAILRIAGLSLILTTAFALILSGALKAFS